MPQGQRATRAPNSPDKSERSATVATQDINQMNVIALVLIACLPLIRQCKSIVQHPASATDNASAERGGKLVQTLAERSMTPGIGRSR